MKLDKVNQLTVCLPGDKSITHRALILSSFIKGKHEFTNFPINEDVSSTLNILSKLGLEYKIKGNVIAIDSTNISLKSVESLDCNESGTTARLLIGYLVGRNINTIIKGSKSLLNRPMRRIVNPLKLFGANIASNKDRLPIKIDYSNKLKPFDYSLKIESAQVKSALILYAISIDGKSIIRGKIKTRDHLENLLTYVNFPIKIYSDRIEINGKAEIRKNINLDIPGDISSASFIICASLLTKKTSVTIKNVSINDYRIGFLNAIIKMGAKISILKKRIYFNEPVADIRVASTNNLNGIKIKKSDVASMIDEIPILSVLACKADGDTIIEGIDELKVKESDRVKAIIDNINTMGGVAKLVGDSLIISGNKKLHSTTIKSYEDHRIFMSFYIANRTLAGNINKENISNSYSKSFPKFINIIEKIIA